MAGARIGKGIQDIEICKEPRLQHSGSDGLEKDIAFCGVRMGFAGWEKLKIVQERLTTERQHRLFSFLYCTFVSHMSSRCPFSSF